MSSMCFILTLFVLSVNCLVLGLNSAVLDRQTSADGFG